MKNRAPYLLLIICILFNISHTLAQTTMQPITGWNMEEKNGSYIFRPEKTPTDKEFIYEVMPSFKPTGQSFDDWFDYAIDKDLQLSGYTLPASANRKNITSNQTIFSFSSEVTDKKGKSWYITYIAYQTAQNEYRLGRVISSPDIKYYANCMRPAATHFGMLAKQTGVLGATVARNTSIVPTEPAREEENFLLLSPDEASKALKSADIKGVLIHLDNSYAPDGSITRVYNPYLVLNDGSIYSDPALSPYNLNIELSKQNESKKWGTWKMKGNTVIVSWTGRNQTEKWNKDWFWATPAMNNERIEGSYITRNGKDNETLVSSDKSGTGRNISLNKSGQFTILPLAENNGNATASSADYTKRNEAGTYKLSEYSIELHFNNGIVLRRAFYFYLQGKTHFGIGNFVYVPKRYVDASQASQ